jgi:DNA-binding MarR family transcriptional regulator
MMSLNRPAPPRLGETAAFLAMDRTTLTANLKPLERLGYVKIVPDKDDKRSRRLILTSAGRKVLAAAVPIWRATHDEVDALFSGNPAALRNQLLEVAAAC